MLRGATLRQIRQDGKVIDEAMTVDKMISLGWKPSRITRIEWDDDTSGAVAKDFQFGVLPKLLPNREGIAVLVALSEDQSRQALMVIDSKGAERFRLSNAQVIDGRQRDGVFCWFEPPRTASPSHFGAVFRDTSSGETFQLDVDGATGQVTGAYRLQR